jgi:hypothetical protein
MYSRLGGVNDSFADARDDIGVRAMNTLSFPSLEGTREKAEVSVIVEVVRRKPGIAGTISGSSRVLYSVDLLCV